MDLLKVRAQTQTANASATSTTTNATNNMASRRAVAATLVNGTSTSTSSSSSVTGMLRHIFAQEGVHGLYRGVTSPLLAVTPAFAMSFWSCDLAKTMIRRHNSSNGIEDTNQPLSVAQIALAGAFSGIPLAFVVGPSERIKCLMQVDKTNKYKNGFLDCAQQVYREGGLRSIFRGTASAVLRDVPGNAAYFATYEYFKRKLVNNNTNTNSTVSILFAGGLAGGTWKNVK